MFVCPNCHRELASVRGPAGVFWACTSCGGRAATIALLRKGVPPDVVNSLWQTARESGHPRNRRCPACGRLMAEIAVPGQLQQEVLDVCTTCQFVWFDAGEYEDVPALPRKKALESSLPQAARERLALLEIDRIRQEARDRDRDEPESWWQYIPALLGMPVELQSVPVRRRPWATWSVALLVTAVSILSFFKLQPVVEAFGLIPAHFARYGGLTLLTSFFLHAGALHLIGNMYFFLVFGDNVEDYLGKLRFIALLFFSGLAGSVLHILGDPHSLRPCIGASGGISGVIAFYALKFPHARFGYLFGFYFVWRWIRMPAFVMFLFWAALQGVGAAAQLSGFGSVSALAHIGGAATGVLFWLATRKR